MLLAAVLTALQIFWPAPTGLANNGDFSKVAGYYDLAPVTGTADEYKRFVADFVFSPRNHWSSRIFSSEHLFAWPAVHLGRALFSRDRFDVRALGAAHLLWLLLAFAGAALLFRTLPPIQASCLALFTLFVFTDSAYASSLNTFYTDTATMLFALSTVVAALLATLSPTRRLTWVACLAVSGVLLILSKMQHSVFGIPLCFLAAVNAIRSAGRIRIAWIATALLSLGAMIFMSRASDPLYQTQPLFTTIFCKIAGSSPDPVRDLAELGLGPEYLPFRGLYVYHPKSPAGDPAWRDTFLRKTGFGKVALFYLHHPSLAARFVWQDLKEFGGRNPDPGLFHETWPGFGLWRHARNALFAWFPAHILVLFALSLGFCAACCVSPVLRARYPAWLCFLTVVSMALLALAVATLADAADTARHLFLFYVLTDLMLCFWAAALVPIGCRFVAPPQAVELASPPDAGPV